jgi:formylmethanofuran dehydrogenase subunit B
VGTRVACPFCGLVCDDLTADDRGVDSRGCAKAAAGFARPRGSSEHRVAGRPATLEEASAAAAAILGAARLPLVTGLGADLAGIRAVLALAERLGAVVDRWRSAPQVATLSVLQHAGMLGATFAEIANRADGAVLVGGDPARRYPRFFERLLRNPKPLYRRAPPWVAYLGPAAAAPDDPIVGEHILVERERLPEALALLAATIAGQRVADGAGLPLAALVALGARLQTSSYGAIVWDSADLPETARAETAIVILHILRALTVKTRCVGLPLGGDDNAQGAAQAMLWQTGWPSRLSFAGGAPAHDPWRNDAERLLREGEVDALLWVAALSPASPPATSAPTVALIAPDVVPAGAAVEIRVGVPGLDHRGTVMRGDTVVALPLAATRARALPSVAAAAQAVLDRLATPA